jgi:hypothetical protein
VLHDPTIQPRSDLSKEQYMKKDEQTTVNHFYEKLLKLKDLMKTKVKAMRFSYRLCAYNTTDECAWLDFYRFIFTIFGGFGSKIRLGGRGLRKGTSSWRSF